MQIFYRQGMEMLQLFKNHTWKTSILDDFMYYENRQKMMQEERARLLIRSFQSPFSVPAVDPPRKLSSIINQQQIQERTVDRKDSDSIRKITMTGSKSVHANSNEKSSEQISAEGRDDTALELKIGTLTINPNNEHEPAQAGSLVGITKVDTEQSEVLTVGSMPVKVNGFNDSSGSLTVGTIPLDPRALQADVEGAASKLITRTG